jgi:hypothetical protein
VEVGVVEVNFGQSAVIEGRFPSRSASGKGPPVRSLVLDLHWSADQHRFGGRAALCSPANRADGLSLASASQF